MEGALGTTGALAEEDMDEEDEELPLLGAGKGEDRGSWEEPIVVAVGAGTPSELLLKPVGSMLGLDVGMLPWLMLTGSKLLRDELPGRLLGVADRGVRLLRPLPLFAGSSISNSSLGIAATFVRKIFSSVCAMRTTSSPGLL